MEHRRQRPLLSLLAESIGKRSTNLGGENFFVTGDYFVRSRRPFFTKPRPIKRQAKKLALNQLRCPRMFTGFRR